MTNQMKADKVLSGTFGSVWMNEEELGNVQKFEAKVTAKYEDVNIAGKMGSSRKLVGYDIAGTMTLKKIDSTIAKLIADKWRDGINPELTIVAKLADPSAYGAERVSLKGVTLDELTLIAFEQKTLTDEEVPFKAESYEYIDFI